MKNMKKVLSLLNTTQSPLIAIVVVNNNNKKASRSVGFIVKDLGEGEYLCVSVAHSFYSESGNVSIHFYSQTKGGVKKEFQLQELKLFEDQDVAVFKVRASFPISVLSLVSDIQPTLSALNLSMFKNNATPDKLTDSISLVRQKTVGEESYFYRHILQEDGITVNFHTSSKSFGPKSEELFPCRKYSINSVPGQSGSPVLDDSLNFFGMLMGAPKVNGSSVNSGSCFVIRGDAIKKLVESF